MNFKNIIAIFVLLLCLAISSEVNASSVFSDVEDNKYYSEAVTELHRLGHISGYTDGTFKPHAFMTRAEVAQLVSKFSGRHYPVKESYEETIGNDTYNYWDDFYDAFPDVKIGDWFFNSIISLNRDSIINGYPSGEFKPNKNVTRAEFVEIVAQAFNMNMRTDETKFHDIDGHYAKEAIVQLEKLGLINGRSTNQFVPNEPITRAEVAAIIYPFYENMHFNEDITEVEAKMYELKIDTSVPENGNLDTIFDYETVYFVKGPDMDRFMSTMPKIETNEYYSNLFNPKSDKNYLVEITMSGCGMPISEAFTNKENTITFNLVFPHFQLLQETGVFLICEPAIYPFITVTEIPNELLVENIRYTFYPHRLDTTAIRPVTEFE